MPSRDVPLPRNGVDEKPAPQNGGDDMVDSAGGYSISLRLTVNLDAHSIIPVCDGDILFGIDTSAMAS